MATGTNKAVAINAFSGGMEAAASSALAISKAVPALKVVWKGGGQRCIGCRELGFSKIYSIGNSSSSLVVLETAALDLTYAVPGV